MNQLVTSDRASLSPESVAIEGMMFRLRELLPQALDFNTINCEGARVPPDDEDAMEIGP